MSIYGFVTVQSLFDELRALYIAPFPAYPLLPGPSPFPHFETRLLLVQLLQLAGFGMAVFGAAMLAYELWVKNRGKPV